MKEAALQFTNLLEVALCQRFEDMAFSAPKEVKPIMNLVVEFETRLIKILHNPYKIPQDYVEIIGDDRSWTKVFEQAAGLPDKNLAVILIWSAVDLTERSIRYYQQASVNCSMPDQRLFFSSIAEMKKIIKKKLDHLLRIIHNEIWQITGYAPYDSTRE